jgi:hypothetical protein
VSSAAIAKRPNSFGKNPLHSSQVRPLRPSIAQYRFNHQRPIDLKSMIGRSLTYCFRIKKDRTITAG